jgi:hypothetical protein
MSNVLKNIPPKVTMEPLAAMTDILLQQQTTIYELSVDASSQVRHRSTRQRNHIKEHMSRTRRRLSPTAARDVCDATAIRNRSLVLLTCGAVL